MYWARHEEIKICLPSMFITDPFPQVPCGSYGQLGFTISFSEGIGINLKRSGDLETWAFNLDGDIIIEESADNVSLAFVSPSKDDLLEEACKKYDVATRFFPALYDLIKILLNASRINGAQGTGLRGLKKRRENSAVYFGGMY